MENKKNPLADTFVSMQAATAPVTGQKQQAIEFLAALPSLGCPDFSISFAMDYGLIHWDGARWMTWSCLPWLYRSSTLPPTPHHGSWGQSFQASKQPLSAYCLSSEKPRKPDDSLCYQLNMVILVPSGGGIPSRHLKTHLAPHWGRGKTRPPKERRGHSYFHSFSPQTHIFLSWGKKNTICWSLCQALSTPAVEVLPSNWTIAESCTGQPFRQASSPRGTGYATRPEFGSISSALLLLLQNQFHDQKRCRTGLSWLLRMTLWKCDCGALGTFEARKAVRHIE